MKKQLEKSEMSALVEVSQDRSRHRNCLTELELLLLYSTIYVARLLQIHSYWQKYSYQNYRNCLTELELLLIFVCEVPLHVARLHFGTVYYSYADTDQKKTHVHCTCFTFLQSANPL